MFSSTSLPAQQQGNWTTPSDPAATRRLLSSSSITDSTAYLLTPLTNSWYLYRIVDSPSKPSKQHARVHVDSRPISLRHRSLLSTFASRSRSRLSKLALFCLPTTSSLSLQTSLLPFPTNNLNPTLPLQQPHLLLAMPSLAIKLASFAKSVKKSFNKATTKLSLKKSKEVVSATTAKSQVRCRFFAPLPARRTKFKSELIAFLPSFSFSPLPVSDSSGDRDRSAHRCPCSSRSRGKEGVSTSPLRDFRIGGGRGRRHHRPGARSDLRPGGSLRVQGLGS